MLINWKSCVTTDPAYFALRKPIFFLFFTPIGVSIFVFLLSIAITYLLRARLRLMQRLAITLSLMIIVNLQFTNFATQYLNHWLSSFLQNKIERTIDQKDSLVVILGRGPRIAKATTDKAIDLYKTGQANLFYISGDKKSTGKLLLKGGIPPESLYGDSCARTTWENALLTSEWINANYLGKQIILITDPWQLPRATKTFIKQGISLTSIPVMPRLSNKEKNFLAKREALGTLIYILLGRM